MRIGSKYRRAGCVNGPHLECVYVTPELSSSLGLRVAVLRYPGGAEVPVQHNEWSLWVEYVEPQKFTRYVYMNKSGELITNHSPLRSSIEESMKYKFISVIQYTYDIHNGLRVEVIPGVG